MRLYEVENKVVFPIKFLLVHYPHLEFIGTAVGLFEVLVMRTYPGAPLQSWCALLSYPVRSEFFPVKYWCRGSLAEL